MADILKLFLEISVMGSIMIGIVLVIRRIFSKKMNPAVMLILWGMVLLRLILPFTISSPVQLSDLFPEQTYSTDKNNGSILAEDQMSGLNPVANNNTNLTDTNMQPFNGQETPQTAEAAPASSAGVTLGELLKTIPWWNMLAMVWMAGIAATLVFSIRKAVLFKRKLKFCNTVADKEVFEFIQVSKKEIGLKKSIAVLECDFIHAPAVFGYFRPCILIPSRFINEMDRDSLNAILLHEIYHIHCHDILKNYIWLAAKALHWFNPFVWLAYKRFEDDVELRRDQKAAHMLEADGSFVYSKSLLEAARFSRQMTYMPSSAAALFENKCKLKQRIFRLIKPQRKTKSAAFISAMLAVLMVFACFTTACQPTPETPAVIGKGDDYIQSMINGNDDSSSYSKLSYSAPESLDYSLDNQIEGVRTLVKVNADIILPENSLPIVSVRPSDISYETVKNLLDLIQNGRLLYDMDTCAMITFKSDVQRKIDRYEHELSMVEGNGESASFYREKLAELYVELEKAPTTVEEANEMLALGKIVSNVMRNTGSPSNPEEGELINNTKIEPFELTKDNYNAKFYNIVFGMGTDDPARLTLNTQYNSEMPQIIEYEKTNVSSVIDIVNDMEVMKGFTLSIDKAIKMAEPVINSLNQDLTLFNISAAVKITDAGYIPYGYNLIFTRNYNGVSANYASPHSEYLNASEEDESQYSKEYPQESLTIVVSTNGIDSIEYNSPQTITNIESSNVGIKSFEEIQEIFNQYIVLTKNDYDTYIFIDKVQLGLMRIDKPNSSDYLVIPVWDFYGYSIGATGSESYSDEEYWNMLPNYHERSFLTISAIDGSIIDRERGY